MTTEITRLSTNTTIVEPDLSMTPQTRLFFTTLLLALEERTILSGTGSPEGVVDAEPTRLYMDESGTAGAIMYVKRDADIAGDTTQGWILT